VLEIESEVQHINQWEVSNRYKKIRVAVLLVNILMGHIKNFVIFGFTSCYIFFLNIMCIQKGLIYYLYIKKNYQFLPFTQYFQSERLDKTYDCIKTLLPLPLLLVLQDLSKCWNH